MMLPYYTIFCASCNNNECVVQAFECGKKYVRTQCRLDFLRTCRHDRIIPYGFKFSKPDALGVTSTYFQDCWYGTLSRTSIELIDLVISETVLQLQNCSLLVETVSNEIIDATSPTEYFSVKPNVVTLIRNFTYSLLFGSTYDVTSHLQRMQNYAAHVILRLPMSSSITIHLKSLHWLPVKVRSTYKIACLCYHCQQKYCTIICH